MDNTKHKKADAIPKLFSHCIRLSVIILLSFTYLLFYFITFLPFTT